MREMLSPTGEEIARTTAEAAAAAAGKGSVLPQLEQPRLLARLLAYGAAAVFGEGEKGFGP